MHRGKLHPSLPIINNLSFHASPCFNLPFAWNGYLILVGKKKGTFVSIYRYIHLPSLNIREIIREIILKILCFSNRCVVSFTFFPRYIYRDRKSDYRISVREVQRLTAFGPKSNSFTISSAEAAVVEFVCQRSDRARDQINRKFRAIWLAQYDSLSKNPPPLSLFEFHSLSLSLSRILLQLLYILLLVRFIHQEKKREREMILSIILCPKIFSLSLSLRISKIHSLSFELFSKSCTFSFSFVS